MAELARGLQQIYDCGYTQDVLVQRYDRSSISRQVRHLGAGALRIPATIARSGVQEYSNGGETWGELRLPEEVFHPASIQSLASVPVTIAHEGGMISPVNWNQYAHGHMTERATVKNDWIHSHIVVSSADAIDRIQRRELVEISAGYGCKLEARDGFFGGKPHKFVQHEIRFNHITLLPAGHARAGSDARLRLDSASPGTYWLGFGHLPQGKIMQVFKFDALQATATVGARVFSLKDKAERLALIQALNTEITAGRLDMVDVPALQAKLQELQGLGVSLVETIASLMEELATEASGSAGDASMEEVEEMVGVEAMDAAVAHRADIVLKAQAFGIETKGQSSTKLMKNVMDKRGIRTDGLDPDRVRDLFERISDQTFDSHTTDIVNSGSPGNDDSDLDKAKKESNDRQKNAWKSQKRAQ